MLYAGTDSGVAKSTDGGATWSAASVGLVPTHVAALIIDPFTPSTLYAGKGSELSGWGAGAGAFKSTDGGATWSAVSVGGVPSVTVLAVDPSRAGTLYTGAGADGVFKSTDAGGTWSAASTGLPAGDGASALAIDPDISTTVYAATRSGVYSLEQVCVGNCNATGSVTVQNIVTLVNILLGEAPARVQRVFRWALK